MTLLVLAVLLGSGFVPDDPTAQVARETDVTFASGNVELAGALAVPPDGRPPFPAVVFVPGGPFEEFDRDADFHGIKLFRQLAQRLAARGVASLRFDKRGLGKSKGTLTDARLAELAADARAAAAFLRNRKEIDARRVGAVAHGEGAAMLLEAFASDRALAAVILLGASSARGDEAIEENGRNAIAGWPHASEQQRHEALDKQKEIIAAVRAGRSLDSFSPAAVSNARRPFFKDIIEFDPKPRLAKLRAPVLLVHGQRDRQVSADHAFKLKTLLNRAGNRKVTVILDPYINHLLAACETGFINEYGALGSKADPETVEKIAVWAGEVLGAIKKGTAAAP